MSLENSCDFIEDKSDILNRYLQKENLRIDYTYETSGPSHCPIFTCKTVYDGREFITTAKSKKDSQKKIKYDIWEYISKRSESLNGSADKIQNTQILRFSEFKVILKGIDTQKPIYLLDLENIGGIKALQDVNFISMCKKREAILICVFARLFPDVVDIDAIFIKREDLHRDSADEGIRRVVYYLSDHLDARNISVITNDHFGQTLKDSLDETYVMTFDLYLSIEEFKFRNSKLMIREPKACAFISI